MQQCHSDSHALVTPLFPSLPHCSSAYIKHTHAFARKRLSKTASYVFEASKKPPPNTAMAVQLLNTAQLFNNAYTFIITRREKLAKAEVDVGMQELNTMLKEVVGHRMYASTKGHGAWPGWAGPGWISYEQLTAIQMNMERALREGLLAQQSIAGLPETKQ